MKALPLILLLSIFIIVSASNEKNGNDGHIESLLLLKKVYEMDLISKEEYEHRKAEVLDKVTGTTKRVRGSNTTVYSDQVKYLLNQIANGLPRSYSTILPTGQNYWFTSVYLDAGSFDESGHRQELDSQIAIQERTLSTHGLNLYDGATWQIALALAGLADVATIYERNVLYTSSTGSDAGIGGLINIRADSTEFRYGPTGITGDRLGIVTVPGNTTRIVSVNGSPTGQTSKTQAGALFYRMIGPKYPMSDPLVGSYANSWKYPWPNNDPTTPWNQPGIIHWNDWKPITGENVWGAITGPIQTMWISNGTKMAKFLTFRDAPAAVQLALTIIPALKLLQSPLGALYHCPKGTNMYPPDPQEETNVSNENNFSAYAALTMLRDVLARYTVGTTDSVLINALNDVKIIVAGIESWFSKYLLAEPYNGYRVFYQGGHVKFAPATFSPVPINQTGGFAVDCQTWAIAALGQAKIDGWYGTGTAYQLWQAAKKFSGYYENNQLGGVGYTTATSGNTSRTVWSAEWTWGAVTACERLSYEYNKLGRADYAKSLSDDAASMVKLMSRPMVRCVHGGWCGGGLKQEDGSYLYANDRFFIPWGWYANPIGSTCSTAWAEMHARNFNPFVLGGGYTSPLA